MPDMEREVPLHQVLELTPEEEARLLDMLGRRGAKTELVVVATESRELAKSLRDVIERDLADRQDAHYFDNLVAALTPRMRIPTPTVLLQARRNALARMELLEEFGALTSHQVADLAGSRAQNRAAFAAKLKSQGKIFSVDVDGTAYFPAFQFDESGQPLPVIERILSHLSPLTEWELALWFTSANGWLEDRRPVDELGRKPDRVVEAAAREHAQFDD